MACAKNMLTPLKIKRFLFALPTINELSIDTAPLYSAGDAERMLGRYLPATEFPRVRISTKFGLPSKEGFFPMNRLRQRYSYMQLKDKNSFQAPINSLARDLENSLNRLQRSNIEKYFFHGVRQESDLFPYLKDLSEFKRAGIITKIGLSTNDLNVLIPAEIDILQIPYRLLKPYESYRDKDIEVHSLFDGVLGDVREVKKRIEFLKTIPNVRSVVIGTSNVGHFIELSEMVYG